MNKFRLEPLKCRYAVGEKIVIKNGSYIRVMAIVDGYVMFRFKGAVPSTKSIADFHHQVDLWLPPEPEEPDFEDEEIEFQCCDNCDLPDACADFGCAIKQGIKSDDKF